MPTILALPRALDRTRPRGVGTGRTPDDLRVLRLAVAGAGLYRGIGLTAVLAGSGGIGSVTMAAAVAVTAVWGAVLVWDGWRRGAFRRELAALDVGFAVGIGALSLTWGSAGMGFGHTVLQGAAIVAGCALPVRALAVAIAALVVASFPAVLVPPAAGGIPVSEFGAYAATLIVLALATSVGYRLVRMAAYAVDRRHADRAGLVQELAEQRRLLHDTALATLTAIANGLDVRADHVRARCARDAAYLRLAMQGGPVGPGDLAGALAAAVDEAAAVGLRVRLMCDALPPDLDPPVTAAIALAVREALNNVHRHAHTGQAWLTAAGEDGRVVARVVDRGTGFAASQAAPGNGIRDSITARMREVGGAATVESTPGEGTYVELRWPD